MTTVHWLQDDLNADRRGGYLANVFSRVDRV